MSGGARSRFRLVTTAAFEIDQWLRDHVGRAYTGILSVGLIVGIGATVDSIRHSLTSANLIGQVGAVVFEVALLINQVAQVHLWRLERDVRREAKRRDREGKP